MVAAAVAASTLATVTTASGAPRSWLPDAELVCDGTTVTTDQWVAIPPSDTLWIQEGPMAGHYVILSSTHYWMDGYVETPPASYEGLPMLESRTHGQKTGLAEGSMTCDFISRWGPQGDPDTFSVVGLLTIAKVSG